MPPRSISFKDTAAQAAKYAGNGTETEYRVTGQAGLVLIVRRPGQDGRSTRGWRFHYSIQRSGRQVKHRVKLGDYP